MVLISDNQPFKLIEYQRGDESVIAKLETVTRELSEESDLEYLCDYSDEDIRENFRVSGLEHTTTLKIEFSEEFGDHLTIGE